MEGIVFICRKGIDEGTTIKIMKNLIVFLTLIAIMASCNDDNSNKSMFNLFKKKRQTDIPLSTAVFTTKNIIKENLLITRVYHDYDSSWQFFDDKSTNSNENIMVVGLGQILSRDKTIQEILDIPVGYFASRKNKNDKWVIFKLNQEGE
jgi:hypothetical protein